MSGRRDFLKTMAIAGIAGVASTSIAGSSGTRKETKLIKPKKLEPGQTIGIIAPASNAWEDEEIRYAMDIVASFGFKVKPGPNLFKRYGYLAGDDAERASDLNAMFADKDVDGIIALRGGYGTLRILPLIDYKMIRKNPKVLVGYSDITALLNAIHAKSGLITFHGPVAKQEFTDYTLAEFKKVLFGSKSPFEIGSPPVFEGREGKVERANRLTRIVPGVARGPLIGGNLSLMAKLVGTPFEPNYDGRILVLEEVNEEPYRIDGLLSQLHLAGRLSKLAGIAFGKCTDCDPEGPASLSLGHVLDERLVPLGKPALRGLLIGHVLDQTTVPIGAEAELDVDRGVLRVLDSPVE